MTKVIIFKQDSGLLSVVRPTPEALEAYGIEAIAQKDVPEGKPYKIINSGELPKGDRMSWTWDDSDLTDGVGADLDSFEPEQEPEPEVEEEVVDDAD